MQIPVQITFRGMRRSKAVADLIESRAADLEKFHKRITGCHVVVDAVRRRNGEGTQYSVRVDLVVPGGELVANRGHRKPPLFDIAPAVDRSFHVARRRLEDFARRMRGAVKQHRRLPIARVSKVFLDERSGFIATPAGREIYFHEHAVRGGPLERLNVGDPVHYVEEPAEEGPNAAVVKPIARTKGAKPARKRKPREVRARRRKAS